MKALLILWRLLDRSQQRRLVALQLLAVLMALSTVGGIAAVLPFFTVLADPNAIAQRPALNFLYEHLHFTDRRSFVLALGMAFAAVVVFSGVVNLLGSLAMNRFACGIGNRLHTDLFAEYLHRDYGFHSQTNSAALATNVIHETGRVTAGILRSGLILIANLVTILCIAGSLLLLNPLVAVVALGGLGTIYGLVYALARNQLARNGATESRQFAARTQLVNESFAAIKELLILQAQPVFVTRFTTYSRAISTSIVNTLAIAQSPRYVLEAATVCVLVGVALYLGERQGGAGAWIAQLTFSGFAAYRLLPALQEAFAAVVRIRAERPAFEHIAADLIQARTRARSAGAAENQQHACSNPGDLQLRNVTFRHAAGRPAAISNLTLHIPAGAVVGFIGANGSGKSTLLDLAVGLLVPQSGQVEVGGSVLDAASRRAWQASIAYVPQHISLLDATLTENIALGVPTAQIDRDRVRAVAALAQLEQVVAALPNGYDESLGERGVRLSGGQRQRLGIARALYRDATLLVLDEATSALDPAAESAIVDMLAAQRQGRTMLIVSHRPTALRHCDVVYQLANGEIVCNGMPRQRWAPIDPRREFSERISGTGAQPLPANDPSAHAWR